VIEHRIVDVRATGVMPSAVAAEIESTLNAAAQDGWTLERVLPVIYNSATTGYFLLFLQRETHTES
jgi:hypothetical protein